MMQKIKVLKQQRFICEATLVSATTQILKQINDKFNAKNSPMVVNVSEAIAEVQAKWEETQAAAEKKPSSVSSPPSTSAHSNATTTKKLAAPIF